MEYASWREVKVNTKYFYIKMLKYHLGFSIYGNREQKYGNKRYKF